MWLLSGISRPLLSAAPTLTIAHAANLGLTLVICAGTGAQQLDREVHSKIDLTRLISRSYFGRPITFTGVDGSYKASE